MADKVTKKLVIAIMEFAKTKGFSIVVPEAEGSDIINFMVIDEEDSQIYIGTKQDYLTSDGGVLDIEE